MKKIIAVLLCVVCLFSSMSMATCALDGIISNVSGALGLEQDDPIGYGITYDSNAFLSGVSSVMYEPRPTVKLNNPGTYTVTDDYPLAVDYQFVCWQLKETKKFYYAGDKIYVDGQITLVAVWEPKNDGRNRVIRVITTAFETFSRSIKSFLGFFEVEVEYDALNDNGVNKAYFDLDGLIIEKHDYEKNKRYFEIAIDPVKDGVLYDAFSRTEAIYFGGTFSTVEEQVVEKDENGKITNITNQVVTKFTGGKKYSAAYEMIGEKTEFTYIDEETGEEKSKMCQVIRVTLTDGVPNPITGQYVTFVLPAGLIRYTEGSGRSAVLHANNAYAFYRFTTNYM